MKHGASTVSSKAELPFVDERLSTTATPGATPYAVGPMAIAYSIDLALFRAIPPRDCAVPLGPALRLSLNLERDQMRVSGSFLTLAQTTAPGQQVVRGSHQVPQSPPLDARSACERRLPRVVPTRVTNDQSNTQRMYIRAKDGGSFRLSRIRAHPQAPREPRSDHHVEASR